MNLTKAERLKTSSSSSLNAKKVNQTTSKQSFHLWTSNPESKVVSDSKLRMNSVWHCKFGFSIYYKPACMFTFLKSFCVEDMDVYLQEKQK